MDRYTVSACHSLKLIPLGMVARFVRMSTRVRMMLLGEAVDAVAVPGSIKVSATSDKSKIKKKITYERSDVSESVADMLELYKYVRLVATYVDESGRRRVCGSPDWPLALDYAIEGGVFTVTLQGEDLKPDGFLMD